MEFSPLILAHTHARNAISETRKSNPVAASEEHDLAAGEFATAAQSTSDRDAFRILQLLEQHHKRLAKIIRFQHENPQPTPEPEQLLIVPPVTGISPAAPNTPAKSAPSTALSPPQPLQQPPRLQSANRAGHRDTTSLASNLATARGIPTYPRRSSPAPPALFTGDTKLVESPTKARNNGNANADGRPTRSPSWKPSWSPSISPPEVTPEVVSSNGARYPTTVLRSLAGDEPFRRFYSTFEGLITKLSAPLAFTSLPLTIDATGQRSPTVPKSGADAKVDRYSAAADFTPYSSEPDVKKLVSSAALQAIKDRDGHFGNGSESFYVVPTSGGMISYASILSRAEKEARKTEYEDDDDNFVDARENPPSPEARTGSMREKARKIKGEDRATLKEVSSGQHYGTNQKTLEELQMENQALKHLSDTLSKRLHMWEINAQTSTRALQESFQALQSHASRQVSPTASTSRAIRQENQGPNLDGHIDALKIQELKQLVQNHEDELERVGKENEKLRHVLGRYRDRWEKLKEGARNRRDTNGNHPPLEQNQAGPSDNTADDAETETPPHSGQPNTDTDS